MVGHMTWARLAVLGITCGLGAVVPAAAQESVRGVVRMPGGRPLSAVAVELRSVDHSASATTDEAGVFTLAVPPGDYEAAFASAGFRRVEATVRVASDLVIRDITMELAMLKEEVHVSGGATSGVTVFLAAPAPPQPAWFSVVSPPVKLVDAVPGYPTAGKAAATGGRVTLTGRVNTDGAVTDISVVESSESALVTAATAAMSEYRYQPARIGEVPMATDLQVVFHFARRVP